MGMVVGGDNGRWPMGHRMTLGTGAAVRDVGVFSEDDHIHMAPIVAGDGRLVTTVERAG